MRLQTVLLHEPLALRPFARVNRVTADTWIVMGMASDANNGGRVGCAAASRVR